MANFIPFAGTTRAAPETSAPSDDRPPRRDDPHAPPATPPTDFSQVPDHDDGPEALAEAVRESLRRDTPVVRWAKDEDHPDFYHLLAAEKAGVVAPKVFKLTPEALDLVIRANNFDPQGPNDTIVFALRGGVLAKGNAFEGEASVEIECGRPNHEDFRCTIGYYDRRNRKLYAYRSSTVPNSYSVRNNYNRTGNSNLLPSGCYVFRVNAHGKGTIRPALRLTEPDKPGVDAETTVLRSYNDLSYTHEDTWDKTYPYDNVHCAYSNTRFSSAGCLTVQGANGDRSSPWGKFQKILGTFGWDKRIDVLLITCLDAAVAVQLLAEGRQGDNALVAKCLGGLRQGSQGPTVAEMQKRLNITASSYFGAATRIALVAREREAKVKSDGFYSPDDDAQLGWNILHPGFVAGLPAPGGQTTAGAGASTIPVGTGAPGTPSTGTGPSIPAGTPGATAPAGTSPPAHQLDPDTLVLLPGPEGSVLAPDRKSLDVPGEGRWQVGPERGKITFTPAAGFSGNPRPVRYQISDILGQSATASLTVTVLPANKAPTLGSDFARTAAATPVSISVLSNDADVDGRIDPTSVRFTRAPTNAILTADGKSLSVPGQGTWTVDADGSVRFAPVAGFIGEAHATYEARDDKGAGAEAPIAVVVLPAAEPPRPLDDAITADSGTPVTIDVLANDQAGLPIAPAPAPLPPVAPPAPQPPVVQPSPPDVAAPAGPQPTTPTTPTAPGPSTAGPGPAPEPAPPVTPAEPPVVPPSQPPLVGIVPLDADKLRRFAPNAKPKYMNELLRSGDRILAEHKINANPMRLCHFLAQIGHESDGFTIEDENLNYKTARRLMEVWPTRFRSVEEAQPYLGDPRKLGNKVYNGRMGNNPPDDGYNYRGRGFMQITGREDYRRYGRMIGVDLEANPDLASDPEISIKVAAHEWSNKNPGGRSLNQLADDNKIEPITKAINGGYNGLPDRKQRYAKAWSLWGTGGGAPVAPKNPDLLERGDSGERVAELQRMLVKAGYFPANEVIDGKFGGNTQKAVMRFQAEARLNVDGIVDKATWEALQKAPARPHVPDGPGAAVRRGPRGSRAPRRETGGSRELLRLAAVILGLVALAGFILFSAATRGAGTGGGLRLWLPIAALTLSLLLFASTGPFQRNRAAGEDDLLAPDAPVSRDLNPRALPPATNSGSQSAADARDFTSTDDKLRQLGFDDKYFEDPEPVRAMPSAPEDAVPQHRERSGEAPELVPEDTLDGAAPTGATRQQSWPLASVGVMPFQVMSPTAPFAIIAMFGGDNNLTHQVKKDLGEMAAGTGRYGNVAVIAIADTETGPGTIVEVSASGQQRTIERMSEIDTGDPETLARFLARALVTFPNARKAIGFWDHGTGVFDEQDANEVLLDRSTQVRRSGRSPARRLLIPLAQREALRRDPNTRAMLHDNSGGVLTNLEAGRMLRAAFSRAGQSRPVDIVYSDTCLNGMIEVAEELAEFGTCIVASADTEPSAGWDYEEWIRRMAYAVPAAPADWARHAVQAFGASYKTQTAEFPCTLAAFYCDNDITEAFAALVSASESAGFNAFTLLNLARSRSQGYSNRDTYDLLDFAGILARVSAGRAPDLNRKAQALLDACRRARIESIALGSMVDRSQGLAFWFPSSRQSLLKDVATYRRLKFNQMTNWSEYLTRMYSDDTIG